MEETTVVSESAVEATAAARDSLWWGALGIAAAVIYFPTLGWLLDRWWNDSFYSHGMLVAGVCGWLAYRDWEDARSVEFEPSPWPIPLVAFGLLLAMVAALTDVFTLSALSLVPVAAGLILAWRGPRALRVLAFPVIYFLFAVPILSTSAYFSNRLIALLTGIAAVGTAQVLDLLGLQPAFNGATIQMKNYTMHIIAPCSGMASLASLTALGALLGYLSESGTRRTILLVIAAIPIVIVANVVRLTLTGLLGSTFGPEYTVGFWHEALGIFTFLFGATLLLAVPRGTSATT